MKRYETMGIRLVREKKNEYERLVYFENDDSWRLVNPIKSMGARCNISYIDKNIDKIIIDEIINPCTLLFPYSGYNYY